MIALLLTLIFTQGTVAVPDGGRVTGVLRTEAGAPASGVRVAASLPINVDTGMTLVSLTQTDSEGRFVLENIPPGRYQILAGRVDRPTFYPGTLEGAGGTILTVGVGATLSGIDFVVAETSYRPADGRRAAPNKVQVLVPVNVTVEGGGALPAGANGRVPTVQLIPIAGGPNLEAPLASTRLAIPVTGTTEEYRVRVENLPDDYRVQSITFGTTNLATDTLKASMGELASEPAPRIITYTGEGELQRIIDQIIQRRSGAKTLTVILTHAP